MRGPSRDVIMISVPDTPPGLSYSFDGRSPDLRVKALPIPSRARLLSGDHRGRSPLTVAGAVTVLAPLGCSSPYSLFIPYAFSAHRNHRI